MVTQPGQLALIAPAAGHVVPLGQGGGEIDLAGHGGCSAGDAPRRRQDIAGADQRLAGHAAPIRALAAHQLPFNQGHGQSTVGAAPSQHLTRRAGSDDHDVVIHVRSLIRRIAPLCLADVAGVTPASSCNAGAAGESAQQQTMRSRHVLDGYRRSRADLRPPLERLGDHSRVGGVVELSPLRQPVRVRTAAR